MSYTLMQSVNTYVTKEDIANLDNEYDMILLETNKDKIKYVRFSYDFKVAYFYDEQLNFLCGVKRK